MGESRERVLRILKTYSGDNLYGLRGLRQRDIRLKMVHDFDKNLSRERIRQLVNSLVGKGLVKREVFSWWDPITRKSQNRKTFFAIN